jgi:MFS family permease
LNNNPLLLPNFRLLFIGRTMSTLSDALVPLALSLAIVKVTGSDAALATVLFCLVGTRLVLLPIAGVVADRFNVRLVAMAGDVTRCVTQGFVAAELLSGHPSITYIAISQVFSGAGSAVALSSLSPLVAGVTVGKARQRANALMGVAKSISLLFGPALAGLLVLTVGPGWVFVIDSTAFATSAGMLALIRVNKATSLRRSVRADLVEGWAEVRSRDWYWSSLIAHATWNFAANVLLTLGPLVAVKNLGGQGVWVAVLQAGGIGLLVGSLLAGRYRPKRPILVGNIVLASYAIPLMMFAFSAPSPFLVGAYGIALAALGFLNPTWDTTVQAVIPEQVLARVNSYDWLVSLAAQPIGVVAAPLAFAAWGSRAPFAATAVLVATACLGTALVPGVRNLRVDPNSDEPQMSAAME